MKLAWYPLWAAGLLVGVGTVVLVRHNPSGSLAGQSTFASAALLAAGWISIAVGLLTWRRRPGNRFGVVLTAVGFAWFAVEWNNPGASSLVFTLGLVLYAVCPPLVAHAALSYPEGRLGSRLDRAAVAASYAAALVVLGLAPTLAFAPAKHGCNQCATNLISVADEPGLVAWLNRAGIRLGLASVVALVLLGGWRIARATPAARRVRAPVLLPAAAFLCAVAATYAHAAHRGFLSNDSFERKLWLAQAGGLALLGVGVTEERIRAHRARSAVAQLVVQLSETPAAGGLRDLLARTLGDPALDVAYPVAEGRHVDASGTPIEIETTNGRATTTLVRGGETIAVLVHRADLLGDPRLVEEVASAARLGFENERLHAEARAQVDELRTSRARLVGASDAERRRLERDLHDGAQQRLVALMLALRLIHRHLARESNPEIAAVIDDAENELGHAIDELRQLASGIHPAVLSDLGFAAALEALAEAGTTQLRLVAAPNERFSDAVETAAYLVVAEAAGVGPVRVTAVRTAELLVVNVDAVRVPDGVVNLEDRIGALDGTLGIEPTPDGGVRIRAEIPCG